MSRDFSGRAAPFSLAYINLDGRLFDTVAQRLYLAAVSVGSSERKTVWTSAWKNHGTHPFPSTMDRLAGRVVSCRDDVGDASAGVIDSFMGNNEERLRIYGESRAPRVSPSNEAGGSSGTRRFMLIEAWCCDRRRIRSIATARSFPRPEDHWSYISAGEMARKG